jgi:hypothetical protein
VRVSKTDTLLCLEFQEAFQTLNQLFENSLAPVCFLVQPKRKFAIKYDKDQNIVFIGGEFAKLDRCDILPQLLHEMIHIFFSQSGIEDVTANQYHTIKYFLTKALSVGLVVIKHKSQGWSITSPVSPRNVVEKEFVKIPEKFAVALRVAVFNSISLDKNIISKVQSEIKQITQKEKPSKTFFLKYVCNCPPPHNSFRSGRRPDGANALNIVCMNCHSRFVCVSK